MRLLLASMVGPSMPGPSMPGLLVVGWLSACSLVRTPIFPDGGPADAPSIDAQGIDVPSIDAPGRDAPEMDVPRPVDAPIDAPACRPECRGEIADDCVAPPRDCAADGEVCRMMPSGPRCVCADAPLTCAADGRAAEGCMDGNPTIAYCDGAGCRDGACALTCADAPEIEEGTFPIDLCGAGDDNRNTEVVDVCASDDADGEDVLRRLVLTSPSRVTLTVRDDDSDAEVDTIVYVRSECDDRTTQLACSDDVPCGSTSGLGPCNGSVQRRESRATVELPRGVHYVIVDSFIYNDSTRWTCGDVELTVEITPL